MYFRTVELLWVPPLLYYGYPNIEPKFLEQIGEKFLVDQAGKCILRRSR